VSRAARTIATMLLLLAGVAGVSGCGTKDSSGDGPVTNDDGYSRLDDAGVEHIEKTHEARLDLSRHSITRKEVGLDAESLGPVVGSARGPVIDLELTAPEGTEEVRTSTFSVAFNGSDPRADYLTWFESYDTRDGATTALRSAVERWGLRPDEVGRWQQALELAGTDKVKRSTGLGVSSSGLVVEAVLSGTKDGGQTHQFQVLLDPRYYEPAALESIRRTGDVRD
jgi:hypothetical protein